MHFGLPTCFVIVFAALISLETIKSLTGFATRCLYYQPKYSYLMLPKIAMTTMNNCEVLL